MDGQCEICDREAPLVRDHNHRTGMIRGLLCARCNSWLGVYQANKHRVKQRGKRHFREWVEAHLSKIEAHIQKDTGVLYHRRFSTTRRPRRVPPKPLNPNDPQAESVRKSWWNGVKVSMKKSHERQKTKSQR